jgi:hypothetical protein
MTARITLADYRALAEFRYRIRQFPGFSERAARDSGLEPRQHQLLLALKWGKRCSSCRPCRATRSIEEEVS